MSYAEGNHQTQRSSSSQSTPKKLFFLQRRVQLAMPFRHVFLGFLFLTLLPVSFSSYLDRPRLFITSSTIADLIPRLTTPNDLDYLYLYSLVGAAYYYATSEPIPSAVEFAGYAPDSVRKFGSFLETLAMAYLLTSDSLYLNATLAWMDALAAFPAWGDDVDLGAAHILYGFSMAFDWLSESITGARRTLYVNKIEYHTAIFVFVVENELTFWVDEYMQNHNHVDFFAMAVGGRAIENEPDVVDVNTTIKAASLAYDNFGAVLYFLQPDGASHEGVAYWGYAIEAMMSYFDVEERRTGVNRMLTSEWFQKTGDYRLYLSVPPHYWDFANFADGGPQEYHGPTGPLSRLSTMFGKPEYAWLVNVSTFAKLTAAEVDPSLSWRDILWYDPTAPVLAPNSDDFPLHHLFEDLGIYTSRSSWNVLPYGEVAPDRLETFFATKAAPPAGHHAGYDSSGEGHVHPDEGSFILYVDGFALLRDNGYSYRKKTWSHNIVTFGEAGDGQYGENSVWFQPWPFKQEQGHCEIIKEEQKEQTEYLVADLTRIYPLALKLDLYRRHFAFVSKKYLLVVDEILLEEETRVTRHFHSDPSGQFIAGTSSYENADRNLGHTIHNFASEATLSQTFLSTGDFSYITSDGSKVSSYHSLLSNFTTDNAQDVVLFSLIIPYRLESEILTRPTFRHNLDTTGRVLTLWFDDDGVMIELDVPQMQLTEEIFEKTGGPSLTTFSLQFLNVHSTHPY